MTLSRSSTPSGQLRSMSSRRVRAGRAALRRLRELEALRPTTDDELHRFVRGIVGIHVPRRPLLPGHAAPFAYLEHAFFEPTSFAGHDLVVWASRGSGKTYLGAVATLLDLLFKPGIEVRILGGSFEQSSRMYRYLRAMFDRPLLRAVCVGEPTQRRIELVHGSVVEVLSQSQTSVRGLRVHKLRCDEVELFDEQVWQAAQLVTRSGHCGGRAVRGTVEALSTMHQPFGLMMKLTGGLTAQRDEPAVEGDASTSAGAGTVAPRPPAGATPTPADLTIDGRRILRWSALDVIERCPPRRRCDGCELWRWCLGRAKHAEGFVAIDDLIAQRQRVSDGTWESEVLCRRPQTTHLVYAAFDPTPGGRHVLPTSAGGAGSTLVAAIDPGPAHHWPGEVALRRRLSRAGAVEPGAELVAGMDFGIRNPTTMLWALVRPGEERPEQWPIEIVDEHLEEGLTLEQNLRRIESRGWPKPLWLGVDPAGAQRNGHSGLSDIQLLQQRGYRVRRQRCTIADGIERIRRRLDRGTIRIAPWCSRLIEAMARYHFDPDRPHDLRPVKDGPDHLCDALRYLVVSLEYGSRHAEVTRYG